MKGMKIEEVAMRIGISVQTLNRWYKFKRTNPDTEIARKIPEYALVKTDSGKVRLWTEDDVWKLLEFKQAMKIGRSGKMGRFGGKGTNGKNNDSGTESTDT